MKVTNQKYFNITKNQCKKNKRYIELLSVLNNRYQVKDFYPTEMKNILIDDLSNMGWIKNKKAFKNSNAKVQIYSEKIAVQIQFGNKAWVMYDILKLSNLQNNDETEFGVIVLYEKELQKYLMSGLGNFANITSEYEEYSKFLKSKIVFLEVNDG